METEHSEHPLPLYIEACEIATVVGWSTHRARKLLQGAKIGLKRGHLWVTTRHLLREHLPEVYEELMSRALALREAKAAKNAERKPPQRKSAHATHGARQTAPEQNRLDAA